MYLRSNCASHPNGSLTVTQKQITFSARLNFGPTFFTVAALRASYGQAGCLVELGTALRIWKCHCRLCVSLSTALCHSILAVCVCVRELFFDIFWEK